MGRQFSEDDINTILDALRTGEIDDAGLKSTPITGCMKQNDIDLLVGVVQELQRYREVGTPEECMEYKKKALGL